MLILIDVIIAVVLYYAIGMGVILLFECFGLVSYTGLDEEETVALLTIWPPICIFIFIRAVIVGIGKLVFK